jgi:hypothetical protein
VALDMRRKAARSLPPGTRPPACTKRVTPAARHRMFWPVKMDMVTALSLRNCWFDFNVRGHHQVSLSFESNYYQITSVG